MSEQYFLAPNARWQGRDLTGQPAVYGILKTFAAGTTTPKLTWSDPAGQNENPVEIPLDVKGEANIYWGNDPENPELYYIELYDRNGNLVYSQDNYPTLPSTGTSPLSNAPLPNLIRNPQFTFWFNSTSYPGILQSGSNSDFFANEWLFFRSNTTATVNISQQLFNLGQTTVPANPIGYLHYTCGDATLANETYKRFRQDYASIQTLSGQQVAFSFWARSATASTIAINFEQNFGTGGLSPSPSVITNILTANLTPVWIRYTGTITIPIAAGTLGTNGDDHVSIDIDLPLNTFATEIDIVNLQLQPGAVNTAFEIGTNEQGYLNLEALINASLFKTGDVKFSLRPSSSPDAGWLACDDGTIGNATSNATHVGIGTYALFIVIWNGVNNTYAPIYDSAGVASIRGATANADYIANKRLSLTKAAGRVIADAIGSGAVLGEYGGGASTSVTLAPANLPPHGHLVDAQDGATMIAPGGGTPMQVGNGVNNPALESDGGVGLLGQAFDVSTIQPTVYLNCFIKL